MFQVEYKLIYHASLQAKFDNAKLDIDVKVISTVIKEDGHKVVVCRFRTVQDYNRFRNDFEAVSGRTLVEGN